MRKYWESLEKVLRKPWESAEKVLRKASECPGKVLKKSWESLETILRNSWESPEKVLGKSWEKFADLNIPYEHNLLIHNICILPKNNPIIEPFQISSNNTEKYGV